MKLTKLLPSQEHILEKYKDEMCNNRDDYVHCNFGYMSPYSVDKTDWDCSHYLILDEDGNDVGLVDFEFVRMSRRADINIYISPDYRNEGLGKEVMEACIDRLFNFYGVDKIGAKTLHTNVPCIELMKSAGLKLEGIAVDHIYGCGKVYDVHYFGLTKKDYTNEKKQKI